LLILIIAILISSNLLLLIIMTNLDLSRRIREIATMKSVGMTSFQSFKVISYENLLLNTTCAILGTLVALPVFNYLYDQINSNVVPLLYEFDLGMMVGINIIIVVFLTIPVVLIFTAKIGRTPVAKFLSGDIRV
ncbi:MAG: FtsX-like permease family protein, partial [Candidatus Hodarchaeales archaeon]